MNIDSRDGSDNKLPEIQTAVNYSSQWFIQSSSNVIFLKVRLKRGVL